MSTEKVNGNFLVDEDHRCKLGVGAGVVPGVVADYDTPGGAVLYLLLHPPAKPLRGLDDNQLIHASWPRAHVGPQPRRAKGDAAAKVLSQISLTTLVYEAPHMLLVFSVYFPLKPLLSIPQEQFHSSKNKQIEKY